MMGKIGDVIKAGTLTMAGRAITRILGGGKEGPVFNVSINIGNHYDKNDNSIGE